VTLEIAVDRPDAPEVVVLLEEHLADMFATSPAESVHALDVAGLLVPEVTFWTARDSTGPGGPDEPPLGCVALKTLSPDPGTEHSAGHAELKSMRTRAAARGRGVGTALLATVLAEAERRGLARVSLETGTEDFFAPARRLYRAHGFVECPPFGDYVLDPHSVFLTLDLRPDRRSEPA